MYLIDTNIFLEVMLNQKNSDVVKGFFNRATFLQLFVSDFSLFSIGIIHLREKNPEPFLKLVNDDILASGIRTISLPLDSYSRIIEHARTYNLDFDDAYQYAVAEHFHLDLVSFDHDFDRTEKKRVTPDTLFR